MNTPRYTTAEKLIFSSLLLSIAFRWISFCEVYLFMFPGFFLICSYIKEKGLKFNRDQLIFIAPLLLFLLFSLTSYFWAARPGYVVSKEFIMFRIYFVVIAFMLYLRNIQSLKNQVCIFYQVGLCMLVALFLLTPLGEWKECIFGTYTAASDQGRLGRSIGFHPNGLGYITTILAGIAIYLANTVTGKKRIAYLVEFLLFVLVMLFTKSRSSILMLITVIFVYYLASEERGKKKIAVASAVVVLMLLSFWAIFHIPILYQLIGFRFSGMFGSSAQQDASTLTRFTFLQYAIKLFRSSPLIGVGLDNFKFYAYQFANAWAEVYSHSNWGELLSGTGLIGTALYYVPQIIALFKLHRSLKGLSSENRKLCALLFSFLLNIIVFDIQKITYEKFEAIYIIGLCVIGAQYFSKISRVRGRYTNDNTNPKARLEN